MSTVNKKPTTTEYKFEQDNATPISKLESSVNCKHARRKQKKMPYT